MTTITGDLTAVSGKTFSIVVSKFNEFITEPLLKGALSSLKEYNVKVDKVVWVPGAYELALASKKIARRGNVDAILCLGCVIKGETPHFDFVSDQAADKIAQISLDFDLPISFGVLTTNTIEQAQNRARERGGNKGVDAALTAMEMVSLLEKV